MKLFILHVENNHAIGLRSQKIIILQVEQESESIGMLVSNFKLKQAEIKSKSSYLWKVVAEILGMH